MLRPGGADLVVGSVELVEGIGAGWVCDLIRIETVEAILAAHLHGVFTVSIEDIVLQTLGVPGLIVESGAAQVRNAATDGDIRIDQHVSRIANVTGQAQRGGVEPQRV